MLKFLKNIVGGDDKPGAQPTKQSDGNDGRQVKDVLLVDDDPVGMSRSLLNFRPRALPEVESMAQLSGRQDVASRPGAFDVLRGHA